MSLATRIAAFVTRYDKQRAGTQSIEWSPPGGTFFGGGISNQPAHETLLSESIGPADTATRAIANRISSLVPLVKVSRKVDNGTTVDETLDEHPMALLLARPHPNISTRQLLRLTGQWIVTVGEAYWLKVGNGFGVPRELHPMPPGRVRPLVKAGIVIGYEVLDGFGRVSQLPPNVVVRFYFPDPENPWSSEGYLGPMGLSVDSHKFASQHLRRHYQFDATPKMALEPQEGAQPFSDTAGKLFKMLWRQKYSARDGSEPSAPAIIPTFYKLIEIAMQSGADIKPLLEYWDDSILRHFGVPKSVLGQVVSGDRSSAETNQYVFDKHTVLPIAMMIADALTLQLAQDFDPSIFVEFDGFIATDKEFELKREAQDVSLAVRTINKVLEDRDDDTVDWGDKPVISGKLGVFDPNAPQPVAKPTDPNADPNATDMGPALDPTANIGKMEADLHAMLRQAFRRKKRAA